MGSESEAYWREVGQLRARYLAGVSTLLRGPLLRFADEQPRLALLRQRLSLAEQVLSQHEGDEGIMLDLSQLRDLAKDLESSSKLLLRSSTTTAGLPRSVAGTATTAAAQDAGDDAAPLTLRPSSASPPSSSASSLRANPRLLQVGAALLKRMQPPQPPQPASAAHEERQRHTDADATDAASAVAGDGDDSDTRHLIQRLLSLMYCSGDSEEPRPDCARIVLRGMLEWQAVAVAAIFCQGGKALAAATASEAIQLRRLKAAYPNEWQQYTVVEATRKLGEHEDADEQEEGGILAPEAERLAGEEAAIEGGGAGGVASGRGADDDSAAAPLSAGAAAAALEARRQFADARTSVERSPPAPPMRATPSQLRFRIVPTPTPKRAHVRRPTCRSPPTPVSSFCFL
jgi:hypothetical protein